MNLKKKGKKFSKCVFLSKEFVSVVWWQAAWKQRHENLSAAVDTQCGKPDGLTSQRHLRTDSSVRREMGVMVVFFWFEEHPPTPKLTETEMKIVVSFSVAVSPLMAYEMGQKRMLGNSLLNYDTGE